MIFDMPCLSTCAFPKQWQEAYTKPLRRVCRLAESGFQVGVRFCGSRTILCLGFPSYVFSGEQESLRLWIRKLPEGFQVVLHETCSLFLGSERPLAYLFGFCRRASKWPFLKMCLLSSERETLRRLIRILPNGSELLSR